MNRLIAIIALAGICLTAHAQNILGTGPDYLNGGPSQSALLASCHATFWRIQINSNEINPAPGVYNFTNAPTCNDAIVNNALATGHTLILDIAVYPLWLPKMAKAEHAWLAQYTAALWSRWGATVQLSGGGLGCWNEPSFDTLFPGQIITNGTPLQLCTEYNLVVAIIHSAAPMARLNVGKYAGFHPEYMVIDKQLGTMALATWYTYHEIDDKYGSPMVTGTTNINGVVSAYPWSVPAKYQFLHDLVPSGVKYGCDEMYSWGQAAAIMHATLARLYGSSMEIYFLMPYAWPGGSADTYYQLCYGTTNGVLTETAQNIVSVLGK